MYLVTAIKGKHFLGVGLKKGLYFNFYSLSQLMSMSKSKGFVTTNKTFEFFKQRGYCIDVMTVYQDEDLNKSFPNYPDPEEYFPDKNKVFSALKEQVELLKNYNYMMEDISEARN